MARLLRKRERKREIKRDIEHARERDGERASKRKREREMEREQARARKRESKRARARKTQRDRARARECEREKEQAKERDSEGDTVERPWMVSERWAMMGDLHTDCRERHNRLRAARESHQVTSPSTAPRIVIRYPLPSEQRTTRNVGLQRTST